MGLRRRIGQWLDRGSVEVPCPDTPVTIAYVPTGVSQLVVDVLGDAGFVASANRVGPSPARRADGRIPSEGIATRRADAERASHFLNEYYRQLGELPEISDTLPTIPALSDIDASTGRLVAALSELGPGAMAQPSRLDGWSVAHVVAHLALNAEAFVRCAADLRVGRIGIMYPQGVEGRENEINSLAGTSVGLVRR